MRDLRASLPFDTRQHSSRRWTAWLVLLVAAFVAVGTLFLTVSRAHHVAAHPVVSNSELPTVDASPVR